ncbi:glycosyl transferase [Microbacterium sp.]|uniref:glycosyl transferase n=1 Tax=Microbacterium sp. TaxID=51671 RepID=UPI003C73DC7B
MADTNLRVMQSFGAPRSTTNPYIHMLDAALRATPGLQHLRFDRRQALFGRYDVLHLHWPESLMGGSTPLRALARRMFFAALLVRVRLSRIAIVRTAHNVGLPDVGRWERRMLQKVEDRTSLRIVLNEFTPVDGEAALIPHGHYKDWFTATRHEAEPGSLAFVGLVRRYKGVETLLDAFETTRERAPQLRLSVAGNPTSAQIRDDITARAALDDRIRLDLRYLSEDDFAEAILGAEGVVLPYRFMHNSGSVLAALSLDRRVLVPRNEVNESLSAEVGTGWVTMFDGELDGDDLIAFHESLRTAPAAPPRLDARDWSAAGARHLQAFQRAFEIRRGRNA